MNRSHTAIAPGSQISAPPPPARWEIGSLIAILALGFVLRVVLAAHFPSIYHPDETFQYLEQGHRLAFGYGVVPWEYREGARLWLVPGFLGGLMWLTAAVGGGAAAYLAVIAGVLSALSLVTVLVGWLWARRLAGPVAAILAATIMATWFELVYFGSKPLTEALASAPLLAAAYLLCGAPRPTRAALFAGGLLLGLTLVLRLQLAPALLVIALWGCFRLSIADWLICGIGGGLVICAAGILDWATWGSAFHSFWVNLQDNLLQNKASQYGRTPWFGYIGYYVLTWSGFTVPLAILALAGARRAPLLLIVPLVIVVSHSIIPHKEIRFLFPAVPFVLLLAAIGTASLIEAIKRAWPQASVRALVAGAMLSWAATSATLIVSDHFLPNLTKVADALAGFADLRQRPSVCGVGIVVNDLTHNAGYSVLHRNLPMYPVASGDFAATQTAFNAAIGPKNAALPALGYRRERCYSDNICVFVRSGPCAAQPDRVINEYVKRMKR